MFKEEYVKDKGKEKGEVTRRDFLTGAGAVVIGGAIGAGIAIPLVGGGDGEVTTKTIEVTKTVDVTKTVQVPTTVTSTLPGTTGTTTEPDGTVTTTVTTTV